LANLTAVELKPFVPARDYALSQRFYQDFGFVMASEGGGVAYFHHGNVSFLLQNCYQQEFAENLQLHLLVADVDAWRAAVEQTRLAEQYGIPVSDIQQQPWRMRDFTLQDPSGVCWRIGQNTD